MRIAPILLVALVCGLANVAGAERWVVAANDKCVREWTPSSLSHGPLAILNAPTMPVRQAVGGGQAGYGEASQTTGERIVRVPALTLVGVGTGTIEMLYVIGLGLGDVVTGGYFNLVPKDDTELSFAPMKPRFLEALKQRPTTDPCGRPL